jgi:hypothetical protein
LASGHELPPAADGVRTMVEDVSTRLLGVLRTAGVPHIP